MADGTFDMDIEKRKPLRSDAWLVPPYCECGDGHRERMVFDREEHWPNAEPYTVNPYTGERGMIEVWRCLRCKQETEH